MDARRTLLAVLLATATACGGGAAKPEAVATTAPPSPTPSPTPTLPPVATDTAAVKKALVTSREVGSVWVTPKSVNKTKLAKGELCPGKKNETTRVKPRASATVQMTEGTKQGAAIASFNIYAFDPALVDDYAAAFAAANKDCAAYTSAEKLYVTTESVTAPAVAGADEVLARLERIYADSSKKTLHYVRQTLVVRVGGRTYVALEHAYIQPKSDPTGADWTKTVAIAMKQVTKARATIEA